MNENVSLSINTKKNKLIFLLSISVSAIWVLGKAINVYQSAIVGAIFEMLWLPVLGSIPILIVASIIFWVKDKFNFKSLNLYSLLIIVIAIIFTLIKWK